MPLPVAPVKLVNGGYRNRIPVNKQTVATESSNMCANRPPIPKKLCQHLIGQYVFRQIYRIPIGSETTLELSRQLKSVICVSIFFSEKILTRGRDLRDRRVGCRTVVFDIKGMVF